MKADGHPRLPCCSQQMMLSILVGDLGDGRIESTAIPFVQPLGHDSPSKVSMNSPSTCEGGVKHLAYLDDEIRSLYTQILQFIQTKYLSERRLRCYLGSSAKACLDIKYIMPVLPHPFLFFHILLYFCFFASATAHLREHSVRTTASHS